MSLPQVNDIWAISTLDQTTGQNTESEAIVLYTEIHKSLVFYL